MPNTSNFSWPTPADTDLVKDGAAAIRDLGDGVDTSLVDLLGGTTGQVLTKASDTDLDFSFTTPSGSPLTTKGDLYTFDTADARLPVGADGTILVADSSTPTGLAFAAPASGGGLTLISETVASADTSITFSAISGSFKQLLLVYSGIEHSSTGSDFAIRLNNNSGSVYALTGLGDLNSGSYTNTIITGLTTSIGRVDFFPFGTDASGSALSASAKGILLVDNYASATKAKTFQCSFSYNDQSVGERQATIQGIFNSTTAVTSLEIVRMVGTRTITNQANTTIRLYGVA